MLLNGQRDDPCFDLTLAYRHENLGIGRLEGPSQIRWPNLPCASRKWEVGEGRAAEEVGGV